MKDKVSFNAVPKTEERRKDYNSQLISDGEDKKKKQKVIRVSVKKDEFEEHKRLLRSKGLSLKFVAKSIIDQVNNDWDGRLIQYATEKSLVKKRTESGLIVSERNRDYFDDGINIIVDSSLELGTLKKTVKNSELTQQDFLGYLFEEYAKSLKGL